MSLKNTMQILDFLYEGVYIVDLSRQITYWNHSAKKITGFSPEEAIGKFCHDNLLNHIDGEGRQLCLGKCPIESAMLEGEIKEIEVFLQHKRGHLIPITARLIPIYEDDKVVGCMEVFIENSDAIRYINKSGALKDEKLKDNLTGLPGKPYIEKVIQTRLEKFIEMEIPFGLAMADIDNFEGINATFGRELSDELLSLLSMTYKHTFRDAELIGRWQNDEFIFVFPGITNEQLLKQCEKIRVLSEGSTLRNESFKDIDFTVSVGGTVVRKGDTIEVLMSRLGERLKKAKIKGGNSCVT